MKHLKTKYLLLFILATSLTCTSKKAEETPKIETASAEEKRAVDISVLTADESDFKVIVPKLSGKDIAHYLEDDSLEEPLLLYYLGKLEASPDNEFINAFDSLSTQDAMNPLRWHLLNKAVLNADGALAENLSSLVAEKIETNPAGFTSMLLDTTYSGRMEVAKNYAFLLAHDIQKLEARNNKKVEDKLIIRAMLACSTCTEKQKAVLEHFFGMVDGLKD
mgnify:CR=1 FL=1